MPHRFSQQKSFERRAIVAIACYFLVVQAFLAALSTGFATGAMMQGPGNAAASLICHGAGGPTDAPTGQGSSTKFLCGLCALAGSGTAALPSAPAAFAPVARAFTRFVAPAEFFETPSAFDPRAGRSRAPPVFV